MNAIFIFLGTLATLTALLGLVSAVDSVLSRQHFPLLPRRTRPPDFTTTVRVRFDVDVVVTVDRPEEVSDRVLDHACAQAAYRVCLPVVGAFAGHTGFVSPWSVGLSTSTPVRVSVRGVSPRIAVDGYGPEAPSSET